MWYSYFVSMWGCCFRPHLGSENSIVLMCAQFELSPAIRNEFEDMVVN